MEILNALRHTEAMIRMAAEKSAAFSGKLEDFTFRAQRITSAKRSGNIGGDPTFIHDLQVYRRELHTFSQDLELMPDAVSKFHPTDGYNSEAEGIASSIWHWSDRLSKSLEVLQETARLAHSHIRTSDAKVEAWYIVQEATQLSEKSRNVPHAALRTLKLFAPGNPANP